MATSRNSTVVGVFQDRAQAERAIDELLQAGFEDDQIGLVGPDGKQKKVGRGKKAQGSHAGEGAVAGALAGVGIGGLVGLGVLAGVIPAIGPAIAAGTLGTILANAAGGAAIASVAGALIGLGIPEEEAHYYESELKAGRYLVTVQGKRRTSEAVTILRRNGGYDMKSQAEATAETRTAQTSGRTATRSRTQEGEESLELREEELHARKTPVKKGDVKVRKDVITEHKTIQVPVTREEVVIERRPAQGRRASSSSIKDGEEIRIPVRSEEVHVEKEPVVKEEVRVSKRKVQDTKTVSGTVRKERARVESEGDVTVQNRGSGGTETCPTPRNRRQ